MDNQTYLSDKDVDFIREMSNIAACSAAGAFSQLLERGVDVKIPRTHIFPPSSVPANLAGFFPSYVSATMKLVGDIDDYLLFLVPKEQARQLTVLLEETVPGYKNDSTEPEFSIVNEIGNILAGIFLRTVYDFCKMSIYHTVPELETDTIFSIIDKVARRMKTEITTIMLIENEFIVLEKSVKSFLMLIMKKESALKLAGSIDAARVTIQRKYFRIYLTVNLG